MIDISHIKHQLLSKTDLDWFSIICDVLKKDSNPTTQKLESIIGMERPNPKNEVRGSKILDNYDSRFRGASINPNITIEEPDQPLDHLGFWGGSFNLRISDIAERFKNYTTIINTYDGGTQVFFHPVPEEYEFTAIDCWTEKENLEIVDLLDLKVNNITFKFGDTLIQGRDGYSMKRTK